MHRQANFYAGLFPEGTTFADPADPTAVDVFYFPDINGDKPVLTAGIYAAAFNDDPATQAVMNYIATGDYAETRQKIQSEAVGGLSGYLSAAKEQDPSVYTAARAELPRHPAGVGAVPLRRLRPDARRRRRRHVLERGNVARERRHHRRGGSGGHRGLLAEVNPGV